MSYDINAARIANDQNRRDHNESISTIAARAALTESQQLANLQTTQDQEADQATAQLLSDIAAGKDVQGGAPSDGPTTKSGMFNSLGAKLSGMGFAKRGLEAFKAADDYAKTENTQLNDGITRAQNQLENIKLEHGIVANHLAAANANNWNQKRNELINDPALSERTRQQLADLPEEYDQETVDAIQREAINAKDRFTLDFNQRNVEWRQQNAEGAAARADRLAAIAEAKQKESARHNLVMEAGKNGKVAGAPTTANIGAAKALILNQIYKGANPGKDDVTLNAGATMVAARANAIMQEDRGLIGAAGYEQALSRALLESEKAGEWQIDDGVRPWYTPDEEPTVKEFKPTPLGKTANRPMPIAKNDDGAVNLKALVKDTYYSTPKGTMKYLGNNQWKLVSK